MNLSYLNGDIEGKLSSIKPDVGVVKSKIGPNDSPRRGGNLRLTNNDSEDDDTDINVGQMIDDAESVNNMADNMSIGKLTDLRQPPNLSNI